MPEDDIAKNLAAALGDTPSLEKEPQKAPETTPQQEAQQETPPVEPEKAPDATEPPVEQPPEPPTFDWAGVNEMLERGEEDSFKDKEGFIAFIEELKGKAGKATELEDEMTGLRSKGEDYEALSKALSDSEGKYDELNSVFKGDKDAYQRYHLAQGLIAAGKNRAVVDAVLDPNFENMPALDVIALGKQLDSKRVTGKVDDIKKAVLTERGYDWKEAMEDGKSFNEVVADLPSEMKTNLEMEADRITNDIKGVVGSVEIPEPVDPIKNVLKTNQTRRETAEKLKESWESKEVAQKVSEKLDTVKLSHEGFEFDYKLSDDEKANLLKEVPLMAAIKGKELSDENIASEVEAAHRAFIGANASKLLSAAMKQVELKSKEKTEEDSYNGKPMDTQREKETSEKPSDIDSLLDGIFGTDGNL